MKVGGWPEGSASSMSRPPGGGGWADTGTRGQLGAAAALSPTPGTPWGARDVGTHTGPSDGSPDMTAFVSKVPFVKLDVDS